MISNPSGLRLFPLGYTCNRKRKRNESMSGTEVVKLQAPSCTHARALARTLTHLERDGGGYETTHRTTKLHRQRCTHTHTHTHTHTNTHTHTYQAINVNLLIIFKAINLMQLLVQKLLLYSFQLDVFDIWSLSSLNVYMKSFVTQRLYEVFRHSTSIWSLSSRNVCMKSFVMQRLYEVFRHATSVWSLSSCNVCMKSFVTQCL